MSKSKIIIKFSRRSRIKSLAIYDIVVSILGKKKNSKLNIREKLGYYNLFYKNVGNGKELVINYSRLGFWLNRGAKLHKNVVKHFTGFE